MANAVNLTSTTPINVRTAIAPAPVAAPANAPAPTEAFTPAEAAPALVPAPTTAPAAKPLPLDMGRQWSDEVIYFPLTDRFHNGDSSNDIGLHPEDPKGFHGGDLKGLTDKLDYIKDLGATTLWLAPIQQNTYEAQFGDYHAYGFHGYWINDHEKVEPRQGTKEDAINLVKTAHEKGMRVVLDTVLNHTGPDHPFVKDPTKHDWFHHEGGIYNWDDQHQLENGELGGLPDLNQSNPECYQYLLNNTAGWVKDLGVDGVRLDAIKHVSADFWSKFVPDLKAKVDNPNLFVLGEVLHGDPNYVAPYQKAGIDYVFDIPLYYTMRDVFGGDAPASKLGDRLAEDHAYQDPSKLVTLLDNHDFPRFMHTAKGTGDERVERLELATTFLATVRGIPSVYYGTEVAMEGGDDPDNRADMQFDRKPEVRQYFTKVMGIRANSEPLKRGEQLEMWKDDKVYAFARRTEKEEAVCVFNNGNDTETRNIPLRWGSHIAEGTTLVDMISGREVAVKDGHVNIEMGAKTPLILVPKKDGSAT